MRDLGIAPLDLIPLYVRAGSILPMGPSVQYATYELVWNDRAKTLTIGPRRGGFAGLVPQRRLNLMLMTSGKAAALAPATKSVLYRGKAIVVRLP